MVRMVRMIVRDIKILRILKLLRYFVGLQSLLSTLKQVRNRFIILNFTKRLSLHLIQIQLGPTKTAENPFFEVKQGYFKLT